MNDDLSVFLMRFLCLLVWSAVVVLVAARVWFAIAAWRGA